MPSPSSSLATLRPDLGGSLEEFDLAMDRAGFVAQRVMPVLNVAKASGKFGRIPIEQLLQTRTTNRASGSGYARGNWKFTDDSYATEEHGAEEPVDDREAKLYADYFSAEQVSAQRAYDAVLRNAELRASALIFNTGTWTGSSLTTAVGTPWSTVATAQPITDVEAAVRKVHSNSGLWPNALVINNLTFRNLRLCEQVKDAIAATGAGSPNKATDITEAMLAAVFDLAHIIVAGKGRSGAYNSAKEGQAVTLSQIWSSTNAMVCRVAETNDIREPCIARTFHWAEDGSQVGGTIETYRDETVRSDIVRVRHDVDEKVIYTEMGHLLTDL